MVRGNKLIVTLTAACLVLAMPARAEPPPSVDEICRTLAQAAADNELPEEFFTRLIWQESHFNPSAVSPKGAEGIAQFMPQTAAMRGLANAFEPLQALRESASYLAELRTTFHGNVGLAAAAYNAGPGAVEAWLADRGSLPFETQVYVRIVTGYTAEAWTARPTPQFESSAEPAGARCVEIAKTMIERAGHRLPLVSSPAWGPWGVQLAGNWSEGSVLAAYERLRRKYASILGDRLPLVMYARRGSGSAFVVRVSEKSRTDANALCAKLRAAGGACVVQLNPRD
jgi:Transglycosylase SLT domain/SPOR domain